MTFLLSITYSSHLRAGIAQLVEQRIENPRVGGSIPPPGTIFLSAGIAQLVERITRNDEVRGSIPRSSPSRLEFILFELFLDMI